MKGPYYLLLVVAGLAACGWGISGCPPLALAPQLLPSLTALLGIIMLLLGALLTFLPRFFQE